MRLQFIAKNVLVLLAVQSTWASHAQEADAVEIPYSETLEITDTGTERVYALHIRLPRSYHQPPEQDLDYPVVYATDSPASFYTIQAATRFGMNAGLLDEAVLVGISREVGAVDRISRIRDFTPTLRSDWNAQTGGAADFFRFIRNEVIPTIEKRYRASPTNRTYVGNSLGGLFGAYVLLTDPSVFTNYVLGSPSLWFDDHYILRRMAAGNVATPTSATNVFVAVGAHETPEFVDVRNNMVTGATEFASAIDAWQLGHVRSKLLIIPEAIHEMAFQTSATHGLYWILGKNLRPALSTQ